MGKRDRKSPYLHHQAPLSRYGTLGGCDKAGRAGDPARPYREKMEERKALLKSAKSDYTKAAAELDTLRAEVIKALRGESAFSQELLSSLIADGEKKCLTIQRTMEAAQAAYDEGQVMLDALNAQYDDIISWADMYDSASMESKKMIVSCLIRRVEVYRDYRLHIDFNIDFEQFSAGLDISAIAA